MIEFNGKELTLQEGLDLLLSERVNTDNGSWAKPSEDDMDLLWGVVYEILEQKFELDCDGDLPITPFLLDRTRYQPLLFVNIPYTNRDSTKKERALAMEMYSMLVNTYANRLDNELRLMRYDDL